MLKLLALRKLPTIVASSLLLTLEPPELLAVVAAGLVVG
jgi:hypothetical protein